jgi:hypothetical protein
MMTAPTIPTEPSFEVMAIALYSIVYATQRVGVRGTIGSSGELTSSLGN